MNFIIITVFPFQEPPLFDYRDQIDAFLIDAYQNNREVVPSSYDFLPKDEREAFHQYLISASYIKKELNNQYYVVFSNDPTQSTQPAFPISHLERDLYNKQADIDKALIKLYQENRIASKDALSEKLTFFNDEQMTRLYAHLQDKGYIKNEIDGNPYVSLPSVGTYDQPVSKNDVFSVLKRHGVIDSNGHILDVSKLDPGQACRRDIDRLFSRGLTGAQYGELLRQDLRSRNQPDALHLTSSAAADTESSSGFQVLDADMVNLARKKLYVNERCPAGVYEPGFGTNPVF